ncbi:MAG: hypothetical protein AABX04_04720 [Nanoarchaeota archaeon]
MNTFTEFIEWVRRTQPELDEAWNRAGRTKGTYNGEEGQRGIYHLLAEELLKKGFQSVVHPRGDNFQIFVDKDIEQTLDLLKELDYKITSQEDGVDSYSMWKPGSIKTTYYRLEHKQGGSSVQLVVDPAELLFYFGLTFDHQGNTAVGRFTSLEQASYHKISPERNPNLTFAVQTNIMLNPYGAGPIRDDREREKIMEDRITELMESIVTKKIPALYQARGTSCYCVVNLP